jgi:transcription elongation GreA/GreB family factor
MTPRQPSRNLINVGDGSPIPLTREGLKQLQEKLARLKASLPDLIEETGRTAAYGDRSENFEYQDAKGRLRRTHRQILTIEDQLKRIVPIIPGKNTAGRAGLGSTVIIETTKGAHSTFQIVGPRETNPAKGRISHESPLGRALMGRIKGEKIIIQTPSGAQEYRVVEIR